MHYYSSKSCREALLKAALAEFDKGVKDTQPGYEGDIETIGGYYRAVGGWWNTYLDKYGDGAYKEVYIVDGDRRYMSWCGIFVAYCGLKVGDFIADDQCVPLSLKRPVAAEVMPSTYRLSRMGKWEATSDVLPKKPSAQDIQPGDIVVVGDDKPYGDHITLAVEEPDRGKVLTVSGNVSNARLGDGTIGEGVGKKEYDFDDIARVYRLVTGHFEEE